MTREELDQSAQSNYLGPGKVNKTRLNAHVTNIADYIDQEVAKAIAISKGKTFKITIPAGLPISSLTDTRFLNNVVLKIERTGGEVYFADSEFTQALDPDTSLPVDTIVMTEPYKLQADKTYFITIE